MKRITVILFGFFLTFIIFSQESIYSGYTTELFIYSPPYECLTDVDITNRDDEVISVLDKGSVVSFPKNNWGGIRYNQLENNEYISATFLAIKDSDVFPEYVTYKTEQGDDNPRWVPTWYFDALKKKDRDIIIQAEPLRLEWDADIRPDVWYKDIPQVASVVLSNTGMTFYTPLEAKLTGFLFRELKKITETTYEATAYPAIQDTNELIGWEPYKQNFPLLQDGNPVNFRYEIVGKAMKIYNAQSNKIVFELIQMPYEWVKLYEEFIRTNKVPAGLTLPEEYTAKSNIKVLAVSQTCIVAEALRLRKEENTTSVTFKTMPIGTTVQILQLGKKQTIDGITANWVQVQLADATKGWCFGGYLVEK